MDEDQDANPVRVIEFIRITLLLWDKYGENEKASASLRHLVHSFYILSNPLYTYEDLYDLLEYVGGDVRHSTRRSKHTDPNALKGRPLYEQIIQEQFGENGTQITTLDQWLFTDVGYYLLYISWLRLGAVMSLYDVLRLFTADMPEKPIPALTELIDRVGKRLKALLDDKEWNDKHNSETTDYWDADEDASMKWFYERSVLSQYAEVDSDNIEWQVNHKKAGEQTQAYYLTSRGRAYILVVATDDAVVNFTPSPLYELMKCNGHESISLRFDDTKMRAPGIVGIYWLYAERSDSSSPGLTSEPPTK